jgi:hypothetical protein
VTTYDTHPLTRTIDAAIVALGSCDRPGAPSSCPSGPQGGSFYVAGYNTDKWYGGATPHGKPPPVLTFHGALSKIERDEVLRRFAAPDGPPVLAASLKAGGVGLNLASAQHVIHYDRWWNPATEDQATDRVWRMGQTALVTVHKFVTRGTVEERIDALIREKRHLSDQLLSEDRGDHWVSELSNRELKELVELRETLWIE